MSIEQQPAEFSGECQQEFCAEPSAENQMTLPVDSTHLAGSSRSRSQQFPFLQSREVLSSLLLGSLKPAESVL